MSGNDPLKPRPAPWAPAPEGWHYEAFEPTGWLTPPQGAGRCRWGAGPKHQACGKPPVASVLRGTGSRKAPWDYCEEHLYGSWLEDGKVLRWRLVRDAA